MWIVFTFRGITVKLLFRVRVKVRVGEGVRVRVTVKYRRFIIQFEQ